MHVGGWLVKHREPQISGKGIFLVTIGTVVGVGLWIAAIFGLGNNVTHENLSKLPPVAVDQPSGSATSKPGSSSTSSGNSASSPAPSGGTQSASSGGLPFATQHPASTKLLDTSMPGYTLFQQTCSGCHGAGLQGVVGPSLLGIGNVGTSAQIAPVITKGFSPMMPPSGGLSSASQVQQVADWLAKQTQK